MTTDTEPRRRPQRVKCLWGGYALCFDDLCHGVDTTMCGLEVASHEDADVCHHGYVPETCNEYPCNVEDDD